MNIFLKIFITFIIILFIETPATSNTFFYKNKTYSGEVKFVGTKFELPEGDWQVAAKWDWNIIGIFADGVTLVQIEKNTIKAIVELSQLTSPGKKPGLVAEFLHTAIVKNKYDGCYDKSEYYITHLWRKGGSFNCLKVRHIDLQKEMFNPDYNPEATGYYEPYMMASFKKFVSDNNLKIPKILISEQHMFYSQLTGGRLQVVYIDRNPEFYVNESTLVATEENSEYHKDNLSKYPKKEKFIKNVIEKSYIYHKLFEENLKVRKHQRLNMGDVNKIKIKKNKNSIVSELEKLNELLKSGVITNKEFESAKKKLLD